MSKMDKEDISEIVRETLVALGFTVNDPTEMQKDMAHIRRQRVGCENIRDSVIKIVLTTSIPATIHLGWDVIKAVFRGVRSTL